MKNRIIIFIVIAILLIALTGCSYFFSNLWGIVFDKNYFIPQESNIFVFNVTKMNDGSGDWWLYGEDNRYYYGIPQYNNDCGNCVYNIVFYFKLQKGRGTENFDKWDYRTWGKKNECIWGE